jgi:NADPH-dependent 2,4-dienoyl-CoA reductase/sulfur reductase-like enzyme/rhodanese-related sulfurtransferase
MPKRLVIVGGVAAGASAAAKARRSNEEIEIVMFERGPYMSFANCGLPYYVGGEIAERRSLFVADPRSFQRRFRVDVRLESTVTEVDPVAREVVFQIAGGGVDRLAYDRLILGTGTVPFRLPLEGIEAPNIFECRTVPDVDAILASLRELQQPLPAQQETSPGGAAAGGQALIIGAGYIGLECAEQLRNRGLNVTVVEALDQILGPLDHEMSLPVLDALRAAGIRVLLSDLVSGFDHSGDRSLALLKSGKKLEFDLAVIGVGVRPQVELAGSAGLRLGETGAIAVDAHQRTSDPHIFAAGDNCESVFLPTGGKVNIPLAGPANKQGRVAGQNAALDLLGKEESDAARLSLRGVLGTSIVRVSGMVAGGTGLTEKIARRLERKVAVAYNIGSSHAGYYPGAQSVFLKLVYDLENGRLLGAQAAGPDGIDKRLDILATAIHGGMTLEDLEQLDLCYAPPFGSAKDVVILTGMVAANTLRGTSPSLTPAALFEEQEGGSPPFLLDVRTAFEFKMGHLPDAVNIPLETLRERLDEIPRERSLVTQCSVGYRSYIAQQVLLQSGFSDVRNLSGGFSLASRLQSGSE